MIPSSPLLQRLETNRVPLDHEILPIKNHISLCEKRVTTIDAEIARLQAILDARQVERTALSESIDRHRGYISPLRRNADVLLEIFLHCLPTAHDSLICASEVPVLLTHVCRDWRNLALSTPSLWSSIFISIPMVYVPQSPSKRDLLSQDWIARRREMLLDAISVWLARSGNCPLSITIYDPSSNPGGTISPFYFKILLLCSRWKRLAIYGADKQLALFGELSPSDLPVLEELTLSAHTFEPWTGRTPVTSFTKFGILMAKNLKRICLRMFRSNIMTLPIDWSTLTHVSIEPPGSSQFNIDIEISFNILRHCSNLLSIQLRVEPTETDTVPRVPELVVLPCLLHLSILVTHEQDVPRFFNCLRTPSLRELTFLATTFTVGVESILGFLSGIAALKHISFDIEGFTPQHVVSIFLVCPLLISLRSNGQILFGHTDWTPAFDESLAHFDQSLLQRFIPASDDDDDYLCPNLTSLSVKDAKFSPENLVDFVQSRERRATISGGSCRSLKRLRVDFEACSRDSINQLDQLDDLEDLDLWYSHPTTEFHKPYKPGLGLEYEMALFPRSSKTAESSKKGVMDYRMFYIEDSYRGAQ